MAKRNHGAAARKMVTHEPNRSPRLQQVVPQGPTSTPSGAVYDDMEQSFFRRGDAGIIDPPVFLPYDSMIAPLLGVLVLAAVSLVVLL